MENKWLDSIGVKHLWDKIKQLLDRKLEDIKSSDETVKVLSKNEISVNVSNAEGNAIQVKTGKNPGLYVSASPVMHKLTFGADKNYVYDGSEDVTVPVYNGEYHI